MPPASQRLWCSSAYISISTVAPRLLPECSRTDLAATLGPFRHGMLRPRAPTLNARAGAVGHTLDRVMVAPRAALSPGRRGALAACAAAAVCVAALSASRNPLGGAAPQQQRPQAAAAQMQGLRGLLGGGGGGQAQTGQDRLVNHLISSELVKTARVEAALRAVDRQRFIDPNFAPPGDAYQDTPLPIGYGQTISAPHMHAICLELLERHLAPGARALDVGSGSGYLAAAMAILARPGGSVLGVEKVPELAARSVPSIQAAAPGLLPEDAAAAEGRPAARPEGAAAPLLEIVHGNVLADVLEGQALFDAIHVGAAADELHPLLVAALAPGGRMVIPLGPRYATQVLTVVDKAADGAVTSRPMMHVGYVPLTRPSEMEDGFARRSW
ncbi:MAG: protein-L-isoaspartate O-methyltransferase-domain-containing protein [Monoraphidium minutum]|nr:MAG: protein-L-isoaspartate O-methyltransferase-domain-containing protein [Monoraphidium minutum]